MSDLEKFIAEHRSAFDAEPPTPGHQHRFAARLEREAREGSGLLTLLWRVAAVAIVVVVVAAALLLPQMRTEENYTASLSLSDISKEWADVERYYQNQLNAAYLQLDEANQKDPLIAAYREELDTLSAGYKKLEEQLYSSGTHEAVLTAMIENFRLRIALIEQIEVLQNETVKTPKP